MLEDRLLKMLEVEQSTKPEVSQLPAFCANPYRFHLVVLSSFFDNWRWYFRYIGKAFGEEVCIGKAYNSNIDTNEHRTIEQW